MIAGVDEVGRGPLAGPVVAAVVVLDKDRPISGLKDSKKLSAKRREALSLEIKELALDYAFGRAEVDEIDEINILQASLLAMERALLGLSVSPELVMVDGIYAPRTALPVETVIDGDNIIAEISAASILAKVARDEEMILLGKQFPQYGFEKHKGYPTKAHILALREYGVLPMHRRSFRPVAECL